MMMLHSTQSSPVGLVPQKKLLSEFQGTTCTLDAGELKSFKKNIRAVHQNKV